MIQFDNGPAGGDYARYIDRLLAQRMPVASMDKDGFVAPRSPEDRATASVVPPHPGPAVAGPALSSAQAAAIATSLIAQARGGAVPDGKTLLEVLGIVAGVVLVLVGVFAGSGGLFFVVAGIGLVASMLKRIGQRRAADTSATAQAIVPRAPARR